MEIAKLLGKNMERLDKEIFEQWALGVISINRAIDKFKINNGIKENIDPIEFERWLHSLGYFRPSK